jgi:transposase-like protein
MPIIRRVVRSGADIYTDGWASYDALAVYGYNHKKVIHEIDEFAREDGTHINGIESFWSFAKRWLAKFNGIPKQLFPKNLLETEWRFNHRKDIIKVMKKLIKEYQQKTYNVES